LFFDSGGSSNSGIIKITSGSIYQDYTSSEFDLQTGLQILELRIPNGGAGPSFDYMSINKIDVLSTDTFDTPQNILIVFPRPSKNGIFNLNRIINWKVYNILGIKIAEGKGVEINLSSFSKGLYILKAEKEIAKSLLFY
jgi:hypothetical protein